MKASVTLRLSLTLSKIMGTIGVITGCIGFISGKDAVQSVFLVALGYTAIGVKQLFNSKREKLNFDNPINDN
jgi:hypothetical protein